MRTTAIATLGLLSLGALCACSGEIGPNGASAGSSGGGGAATTSGATVAATSGTGGTSGTSGTGGAGGTPVGPPDWNVSPPPLPSGPEVRLVFPTYGATQASQIALHGTAYKAQSVAVNGQAASLVANGDFSTWTLGYLPLAMGDNVVTVTGTDSADKALTPVSVTVTRTPGTAKRGAGFPTTYTNLFGLSATKDGKFLYASQGVTKGLYRIELGTGDGFETKAFAGSPLNKTGVVDPTTSDVALVENGKYDARLFAASSGASLRYYDTGSYEFHGFLDEAAMAHLYNVAYHRRNDRLVLSVLDDDTNGVTRILAIDPSDPSSVEVLADTGVGLKNFKTTLLDEVAQRFYYADYYDDTGSINFVSLGQPATTGSLPVGPTQTPPQQIEGMAMCPGSSVLYVVEDKGAQAGWQRISAVDVATGARHTVVDSPSTGTGVVLANVKNMLCVGDALYVSLGQSAEAGDPGCMNGACPENKVISIDPDTGDRLVVSFFDTNTEDPIPGD